MWRLGPPPFRWRPGWNGSRRCRQKPATGSQSWLEARIEDAKAYAAQQRQEAMASSGAALARAAKRRAGKIGPRRERQLADGAVAVKLPEAP